MTVEGMLTDHWAHHFFDNPNAGGEEFEDTDFDLEAELRKLEENPDGWETLG